jgi:Chaperone of endosialidase
MKTLQLRNSVNRSPLRLGFILSALIFVCFALLSATNAFGVTPAPDGGYPGANTAEGNGALFSLTTGVYNTANGLNALSSDTMGNYNTAIGGNALLSNTTASANTATGVNALLSNTTGSQNTADGVNALRSNTTASGNTAVGDSALFHNTGGGFPLAGSNNTAVGRSALFSNTTGVWNTAVGSAALGGNTRGALNTATGAFALGGNGVRNTAMGYSALLGNTTGGDNTAVGSYAGYANLGITGSSNTFIGSGAGNGAETGSISGSNNTALGAEALLKNSTGNTNTALGFAGGENITGNNNIDIGNLGVGGESNTIRIGEQTATTEPAGIPLPAHTRTFIAGIFGQTSSSGTPVYINSNGKLGTTTSSKRFKDDIRPMDKASEAILALKPVTFRYKKEIDPEGIAQFGLVAEQVEKVNPNLVARDAEGKVYTVRYEAVNAMLLNEFLKEHQKVQKLEAALAAVNQRLKEQDAKIDKVNAKVELTKPAPQVANNGQ